jgi:hypothetical protein
MKRKCNSYSCKQEEAKQRAANYMRLKNGYKEKEPMTPQEKEFVKVILRDFLIVVVLIAIAAAGLAIWMW